MIISGIAPEKIKRKYTGMFAVGKKGNMPEGTGTAPAWDMPEDGGPPPPGGGVKGKPSSASVTICPEGIMQSDGVYLEGEFFSAEAQNVRLNVSDNGYLGGVYVDGTDYTMEHCDVRLDGNGISLGGPGSGVCSDNRSEVIIRDSRIETTGSARCATSAEHDSILKVYNSTLISHGAPFGSELPPGAFMATPPAALEIDGNCRTHVTMTGSESYFYDSTISADGWAALSTDISDGWVYLEANDCVVETVNSGYGAYADGGCHDVLNRCKVKVASMALIAAGECTAVFRDCECDCGSYFLLSHCIGVPEEVSEVDVIGGSIHTKEPLALLKSCNVRLDMAGVQVHTDSGVLIRTVVNDDPMAEGAVHPKGPVYGVRATLRDMDISGDVIHGDYETRELYLSLQNTKLQGAVQNICLSMDNQSAWFATGDSTLMLDGDVDLGQINAPKDVTVTVTNGIVSDTFPLASGGTLVIRRR